MNPHKPHLARLQKKRASRPLTMPELLRILTTAISQAEALLLSAGDDRDFELRCIHGLSQVCGQYAKLLEIGELEARLSALEAAARGKVA
jgi:hypothetical protein